MICQSLLLLATMPFLSSASILSGLRQSVNNVLHFEQQPRERPLPGNRPMSTDAGWNKPAFCNDLDCPEFTVIKNESTYQVREYVVTRWVSTNSADISFQSAQYTNFMRLFDYISGKNEQSEKIAMTAPVLTRIIPGPGPACENNFTMSFFISPKVSSPPEPSDAKVFLNRLDKMTVYVRSFPGFAFSEQKWIKEAAKLASDLGTSVSYVKDYYYTAGYNSPYQLTNRHNEIWFLAQ